MVVVLMSVVDFLYKIKIFLLIIFILNEDPLCIQILYFDFSLFSNLVQLYGGLTYLSSNFIEYTR